MNHEMTIIKMKHITFYLRSSIGLILLFYYYLFFLLEHKHLTSSAFCVQAHIKYGLQLGLTMHLLCDARRMASIYLPLYLRILRYDIVAFNFHDVTHYI